MGSLSRLLLYVHERKALVSLMPLSMLGRASPIQGIIFQYLVASYLRNIQATGLFFLPD